MLFSPCTGLLFHQALIDCGIFAEVYYQSLSILCGKALINGNCFLLLTELDNVARPQLGPHNEAYEKQAARSITHGNKKMKFRFSQWLHSMTEFVRFQKLFFLFSFRCRSDSVGKKGAKQPSQGFFFLLSLNPIKIPLKFFFFFFYISLHQMHINYECLI